MKSQTLLLLVLGIFAACEYKDLKTYKDLIGAWKLTEWLIDPGDGSGSFTSVNSNKTISFYRDGTFYSNGLMCSMDLNSDQPSYGTYSPKQSTITLGCQGIQVQIHYVIEGDDLIVNYACFERCSEKFTRL